MKVYFHFNLKENGFLTAVVEGNEKDCPDIKSCLQLVCTLLQKERKISIEVSWLDIYFKKKLLTLDASLSLLTSGDDLHVEINDDRYSKNKVIYEKTVISESLKNGNELKTTVSTVENNLLDSDLKSLLSKAKKYIAKNRFDLAITLYKEIIKKDKDSIDGIHGIAYIYFKALRFSDAIPYFMKVVQHDPSNFAVLIDYCVALIKSGDCQKSISVLSHSIDQMKRSKDAINKIHDANVVLASALETMGELQHAFQLYLTVAQMTDKQHVDGLVGYARVGFKLNQVSLEDVFLVLLNAIVKKKNDKDIKKLFVEMVQQNGGYNALILQMQDAKSDPTAVVYIATIVREYGALSTCKDLLKQAFALAPNSIDIALLLTHVFENLCYFDEELKFAMEFINGQHDRQELRRVDLSPVPEVLKLLLSQDMNDLKSFINSKLDSTKDVELTVLKGNMADIELQLLALYFTVVKTCFVLGHLDCISLFLKLLDPLFNANENLHKTLIKNEQAYYSCISQIYRTCQPLEIDKSSKNFVYVVGESHVLPLAWRNLKINDINYVIHPILVTGIKIWHLRKESKFYTSSNFENAIRMIPNGSTCLFLLGEIDCREGIQHSIEKCCYDSVEQCVKSLTDIYTQKLLHLQKSKKLKIYVHPVVPSLKKTIENVRLLNECLKNDIRKLPRLTWLDFADDLIAEDGCSLKEEFYFDGIHLHPSYLRLIQQSVEHGQ